MREKSKNNRSFFSVFLTMNFQSFFGWDENEGASFFSFSIKIIVLLCYSVTRVAFRYRTDAFMKVDF